MVKSFKQLKGDILTLQANPAYNAVYASGVDSRVVSIQLQEDQESGRSEWTFTSIFRGQSHDINSLALFDKKTLLSGGLTTDICVYKLKNGRFPDQFGKKNESKAPKLRHVAPFSFFETVLVNKELVLTVKEDNLEILQLKTGRVILKIERKNEFAIQTAFFS